MSSSFPPQLQLTLQPNTTSFKRSFEQFGFDLASPVDGGEGSSNDGNDRNKRARSETSFSDTTDTTESSQSSMLASASSSSMSPLAMPNGIRPGLSSITSFGPPRLPTPDIEDIHMPDYPNVERHQEEDSFSQNEARYRLSFGSLNSLDNENVAHRSQPSSPRLPTPPPVLPPLAISDGQRRLSISSNAISFLQTPSPSQPASPLTDAFFGSQSPSRTTPQNTSADDSELIQGFRARLSGALERLVPQSPLVPGLELDDREEQLPTFASNRHLLQEPTTPEVPPEPPILPPIPTVSTTAGIDQFNIEALLTGEGAARTMASAPPTSRSSISPSLNSHPLPSPSLRDLRSWMDGQEGPTANGFVNPTARHWQLRNFDPTSLSTFSNAAPSVRGEVTGMPDNSGDPHNRPMDELSTQSLNLPQTTDLWERRSFEPEHSTRDETTLNDNSSRRSITRRSSSPDHSWLDHTPRLPHAFRRRSRLGSSISLVTENSLEARRMAEYNHIVRDVQGETRLRMDEMEMDVPRSDGIDSTQNDILSRLDLGRSHAPYVLPPLPTPSLDVAPDAREEEEIRPGSDLGHGTGSSMWYHLLHEGNYHGTDRGTQAIPESSHFGPGPRIPLPRYPPPPRPSSPIHPSPPVAVLPPTNTFAWVPRNHRAPVGDVYNRRPHVNLTRHLTLGHRREPPPLLPQPDFGHAFVTEGQDRDMNVGASQAASHPHGPYHTEVTPPNTVFSYLQQPRTHREETTSYVSHSVQNRSRPPSQLHRPILPGDMSLAPPLPRQPPQPVQNLSEIPGRPQPQLGDNRRVLRFALPQPEESGRFSSSPVGISEEMPYLATAVYIDNRMENQASSPLQPTQRLADPRYLSGSPIPENVDHRRDTLPAYSPTTLDPASFAPGPFRNTIHQTFYPRMNRPTPPTIPPLPFQEPAPGSHFQPDTSPSEATLPRGHFSRDEPPEFNYSIRLRRQGQNAEPRAPRNPFASTRVFNSDDDGTPAVRRRMPLHSSVTQEARLEASRLSELLSQETNNNPSVSGTHGQYSVPRNDSLRSNTTVIPQQQLANLLHQHAHPEAERRRDDFREGTHMEGPQANGPRHTSNVPLRRFSAFDLEHLQSWRTRARGRFRITPELLASRLRPGTMGDFIHDDDFDDSYENLINLAVVIGDVKPKSTPGEVLEKLEKGIYKDWKSDDGDKRCPICLDDYSDHDALLKLDNCNHWFHQACLKQWLHTASTCPVCRKSVHNSASSPNFARRAATRRFGFWRGGPPPPPGPSGSGTGEEGPSNRPRGNINTGTNNRWSSPLRRRFD